VEARKPDVERTKLQLKDLVHILAVFGGVYEATHILQPWDLLERRCVTYSAESAEIRLSGKTEIQLSGRNRRYGSHIP
jgi:hypothetical protein